MLRKLHKVGGVEAVCLPYVVPWNGHDCWCAPHFQTNPWLTKTCSEFRSPIKKGGQRTLSLKSGRAPTVELWNPRMSLASREVPTDPTGSLASWRHHEATSHGSSKSPSRHHRQTTSLPRRARPARCADPPQSRGSARWCNTSAFASPPLVGSCHDFQTSALPWR